MNTNTNTNKKKFFLESLYFIFTGIIILICLNGDSPNIEMSLLVHPWFVTGFTEGDGCFSYQLSKGKNRILGYQVQQNFQIEILNTPENRMQLNHFKSLFDGNITSVGISLVYRVTSLKDQLKIRDFFNTYPQQTTKVLQFNAWCQILDIMLKGDHLTILGFESILAQTNHFPKGISFKLQEAFPHIVPSTPQEYISSTQTLDPNWIAGIVASDGSFSISQHETSKSHVGCYVKPLFRITQQTINLTFLKRIQNILGGKLYERTSQAAYDLQINNRKEFVNMIIPFFTNNPQHGTKALDFHDWSKIIKMMQDKRHQTHEGMTEVRSVVSKMNSKRY